MLKYAPASRLMAGLSANEYQPLVVTVVDPMASGLLFGGKPATLR
jgi:hypothetical protein